jgi:hypothetical protein
MCIGDFPQYRFNGRLFNNTAIITEKKNDGAPAGGQSMHYQFTAITKEVCMSGPKGGHFADFNGLTVHNGRLHGGADAGYLHDAACVKNEPAHSAVKY